MFLPIMLRFLLILGALACGAFYLLVGVLVNMFANDYFSKTHTQWKKKSWWHNPWFLIPCWPVYKYYLWNVDLRRTAELKAEWYYGKNLLRCPSCHATTRPFTVPDWDPYGAVSVIDAISKPMRCYYCGFVFSKTPLRP